MPLGSSWRAFHDLRQLSDIFASTHRRVGLGMKQYGDRLRNAADGRSCQKKEDYEVVTAYSRITRSLAKLAFSDIKNL